MPIDVTILIGALAAGAFAGALLGYLIAVGPARLRAAETERKAREALAVEKAKADADAGRVPGLEREIGDLREKLDATGRSLAEARTGLEAERRSHAARVEELEKMGAEIERKFTALAADALGKNSESFLKLVSERFDKHKASAEEDLEKRRREIESLVKPIGEGLGKFERKIDEIEKAREGAYRAVTEQVKQLSEGQTDLRSETGRLVQALRRPQTRGRWGEYQLRNVLEMADMTEHVDFVEQPTVDGESGRLRPDVVVRLPGGKSIVVDAKTPLEAYLDSVEAENEEARAHHLKRHASQLHSHVRALASQDYWKALSDTPDFVVMFVPGEAFFAAGLESDPTIFERAVKDRVLITTPTTFIALVKAIAYGWQQQQLAENTREVSNLARDLFDRIKMFGSHMEGVGSALGQAVAKYNKAVGSLERRVLPAGRKLESLGVTPSGESILEGKPVESGPRSFNAPELTRDGGDGRDQER